jgi:hypothetical protein
MKISPATSSARVHHVPLRRVRIGKRYGRLGTTALNVLTLEVYYRYLPLYKRSASGEFEKLPGADK